MTSASRTTWMIHTAHSQCAGSQMFYRSVRFPGNATAAEAEMQVVSKMVVSHLLHPMQLN